MATPKKPAGESVPRVIPAPAVHTDPAPVVFADKSQWGAWLALHHATSTGVWLKLSKKSSGVPSVTYPEALDVALAWGWIDAQKRGHDEASWLQRFCPRRPRSIWSRINRDKALALITSGEMAPAGMAEVERARADGRWDNAYEGQRSSTVHPDLDAALRAHPDAAAFFASLDAANRYAVLFRVQTATTPALRAGRIERLVAMLLRHETLHPQKPKP